jgi:hypothetical protein
MAQLTQTPPRSGVNLNLHFHTLALDGVFSEDATGGLAFHAALPPSDAEVAEVLATVRHRVRRLLVRRGLASGDDVTAPADPLAEESPVLAGIAIASVQGRVALGPGPARGCGAAGRGRRAVERYGRHALYPGAEWARDPVPVRPGGARNFREGPFMSLSLSGRCSASPPVPSCSQTQPSTRSGTLLLELSREA